MSVLVAGVVGSAVVGAYSANRQAKAGEKAAEVQGAAAQAGIDEESRRFDAVQALLKPYVDAGLPALTGQQNLIGLNGNDAQAQAIRAIQESPQFTMLQQQGETRILQNASATGGLRGGNTQAALAQFSPQLLNQLIEQQYGRLGGMVNLGQNSAAGVGQAGMQTGSNIAGLLQQQGAAGAGGALAGGNAYAGYSNAITGALGLYGGLGGFKTTQPTGIGALPAGSAYDYRGTTLPDSLRGGF